MNHIEMEGVCKKYGSQYILKNFNLSIEKNEFVAIIGPSGSGKSTLLNIIGLIEPFDEGILRINGYENPRISTINGTELLRWHISYLFQNYGLMEEKTVKENMKIATKYLKLSVKEENERIASSLERVGLYGIEKKKVYQLSGGEQQRIALAKTILKPSEIVLADEPTGSLDSGNRDMVMEILHAIHQGGKTVVIVTHDDEVSKHAERIIRLGRGGLR